MLTEAIPQNLKAANKLKALMSDISEDHYCAGWLFDLEFGLWDMVRGGDTMFGFHRVTKDEVDALLALSCLAEGWWMWDDERTDEVFVSIATFIPHYQNWKTRLDARKAKFEAEKTDCPRCSERQFVATFGVRDGGLGNFSYCDNPRCRHITDGGVIIFPEEYHDA